MPEFSHAWFWIEVCMYVPTTSLFYSNNAISRLSNQIVGCTRCNMHAYAAVKLVKWCDCVSANSRAFIPDFPPITLLPTSIG